MTYVCVYFLFCVVQKTRVKRSTCCTIVVAMTTSSPACGHACRYTCPRHTTMSSRQPSQPAWPIHGVSTAPGPQDGVEVLHAMELAEHIHFQVKNQLAFLAFKCCSNLTCFLDTNLDTVPRKFGLWYNAQFSIF